MTERDKLIWAAGFFDGEGCVSIVRNIDKRRPKDGHVLEYERFQLVAVVVNKARAPLDVFVELFGGSLRTQKATNGSTYWKYKLNGKKAVPMLERLLPYMITKSEVIVHGLRLEEYIEGTISKTTVLLTKGTYIVFLV